MPYCPGCRTEYAEGVARCPECQVPLVDQLSAAEVSTTEATVRTGVETFVTVFEGGDSMDFRMAKGLLESNGFHLKLIGGHDSSYPPLAAHIQVPEDEAEDAKALLNDPGAPDDPIVE